MRERDLGALLAPSVNPLVGATVVLLCDVSSQSP